MFSCSVFVGIAPAEGVFQLVLFRDWFSVLTGCDVLKVLQSRISHFAFSFSEILKASEAVFWVLVASSHITPARSVLSKLTSRLTATETTPCAIRKFNLFLVVFHKKTPSYKSLSDPGVHP